MKNQMNKKTLQSGILILVSMLFYLYFAWHDGVVICEDSPTYINMNITREPLYPLLLEIMRRIFRELSVCNRCLSKYPRSTGCCKYSFVF